MGSTGKFNNLSNFISWRNTFYNNYGIDTDFDINTMSSSMMDLSAQQKRQIENEVKKFVAEFPEIKKMNVTMQMANSLPKLNGQELGALFEGDTSQIKLTKAVFDNNAHDAQTEQHWYAGVFTGFHPQGTTSTSDISHELGHALVSYMARVDANKGYNGDYVAYLKQYDALHKSIAQDITDKASNAIGQPHDALVGHISHYASFDRKETISEAISDYIANGNKANVYSKAIVKELKNRLKGY